MANKDSRARSRVGVIDLGSNTVLLLVLEERGRIVCDEAKVTRLGEGVFTRGEFHPEARERTRAVVEVFSGEARAAGVEVLVGVGTEALRCARDGAEFLEGLRSSGLLDRARILDGEQEARLAIEASRRRPGALRHGLQVIDVGGGSTEVSRCDPAGRVRGWSLPLGSVRLTEALVRSHPIPIREIEWLRAAVNDELLRLGPEPDTARVEAVVAVGGTATTLAALELRLEPYDPDRVEGTELTRGDLCGWIERLAGMSVAERRALPGMEPGRADVIVAGLVVLAGVLEWLGADRFRSSGRGLRHGVALRLLDGVDPPW